MGDENELISQDEIERLLQQSSSPPAAAAPSPPPTSSGEVSQDEINALMAKAPPPGPPPKPAAPSVAAQATNDADKRLGQDDIERLLNQAGKGQAAPPKPAPAKDKPQGPVFAGEGDILQEDVDYLLRQAEEALESISSETKDSLPTGVAAFRLQEFSGATASTENATFDLIRDVELDLKIELGRTHMYLEDVLKLRRGSVVPLDKLAGDPVDIYVNGRLIARGEVLVLNDNFCVRVAELIAGTKPAA
jgi:flagellar motor switch protein FliN/FliY